MMEHFFEISQKLFSLSIDGLLGLELRLKKEDQLFRLRLHLPVTEGKEGVLEEQV
jgi:hypothetical protein